MVIDYKPIANGVGAIVESQAQYLIDLGAGGSLEHGYQAGIADELQVNKTLRQASMIAAAVATFIGNLTSADVLDDGDLAALVIKLTTAIGNEAIAAVTGGSTIAAQGLCKLTFSTSSKLLLMPYNGNSLIVNGSIMAIPAAGLPLSSTLPNPVIADNTDYNAYAMTFSSAITSVANNGGGLARLTIGSTTNIATGYPLNVTGTGTYDGSWTVTVIDATHVDLQGSTFSVTQAGLLSGPIIIPSTTAHVAGTNGTQVMSGDATKAFVGKFRLNGAANFQQDQTKWLVRSWFNDGGFILAGTGSSGLMWANEGYHISAQSVTLGNGGGSPFSASLQCQFDGGNVGSTAAASDFANVSQIGTTMTAVATGFGSEATHTFAGNPGGLGTGLNTLQTVRVITNGHPIA